MKAMENRGYDLKYFSKFVIWRQTHLAPLVSKIINWDENFVNNIFVMTVITKIFYYENLEPYGIWTTLVLRRPTLKI